MHEVYPTQYTSRMGTSRVKQEEETEVYARVARNMEERNVGTKGQSPNKTCLALKI